MSHARIIPRLLRQSAVRPAPALTATALALSLTLADKAAAQIPPSPPNANAANNAAQVETVVVTAQKRGVAENAQSVPIALAAFDQRRLTELQVRDLEDLSTAIPNVALSDAGTVPGFANFTIRGLGINSTIPSVEPTVGVFVDGVYVATSSGVLTDLFEVSGIEVLRGPQGLLFGRNTTGGAVLINTSRPGPEFAVHGRTSIETGLQESAGLSIESPIGRQFRAKIAGYFSNDNGWFTNRFDGRSFSAQRSGLVRPTLMWLPSDAFDSTLIYERGWMHGQGAPAQNPAYFSGFTVNVDNAGYNRQDWEAVTLESNWRPPAGIVTNIFGYRRFDQSASDDIDAQPTPRFNALNVFRQHQTSDELRYSARMFDRVDLTAGLFYFTQSYFYLERRVLGGGAIDSTMGANVDNTNYAAFAQAGIELTPAWTLIAGARLTREEKSAQIATFRPATAASRCNFAAETCVYNFPGPAFPNAPGSASWEHFTPKLGLNWQPDETLLIYGNWTRGVRSGGYNVRNTSTSIAPGPYDPELQDAFEIGVKSDLLDRRFRANAAMFYDTIKDMQRDVNLTDPLVGVVQVTRNTADATIKGAELELTGLIGDGLELSANAGYTEGAYDKIFFDLDGGGIGASDRALNIPRLTKWTYDFAAVYTHMLAGDYTLQLRADYGFRSRSASTDNNTAFLTPVENLSAGASVTLPDGRWTLSVYGRNLLDKVTDGVVTPLPASVGGGAFRTLNEGRVVGASASFRY